MIRAVTSALTLLLPVSGFAAALTALPLSTLSPETQEMVALARESLLTDLRQARPDLTHIDVALVGRPVVRVPVGAELSVLPGGHALATHERVWVNVRQQGRLLASVPVWFSVRALGPVLVTRRAHHAHESVDRSDTSVEECDVAALVDRPLDRQADLALLRTRHAIASGHVLLQRDLEERPPILAGEDVAVEVTYRSVAIETRAVALKEGRIGEPIVLKNPDSTQTYGARVTGPGRAEVIDR